MAKRFIPVAWVGVAALIGLTAAPVYATEGRTYWACTKFGCVQIAAPSTVAAPATPAKMPAALRPVAAQPRIAAKKPVPLETLIDLSLVTGVFQ